MSVIERVEDPGRFTLQLDGNLTPPSLLSTIDEFGHIVIMRQRLLHPGWHSDADILAAARYTGTVIDKEYERDSGTYNVRGQGLERWLGDSQGNGPTLSANVSYSAATVDTVLAQIASGGILPPAIQVGTITTTGVGTFTGDFEEGDRCIDALRTVAASLKLAWKINPDGTLDACLKTRDEVFRTTADAIQYAVIRDGSGGDPIIKGVQVETFTTSVDAKNYATRLMIVGENYDGSKQILGFADRDSIPYKDLHGNEMVWAVDVGVPNSDLLDWDSYFEDQFDDWDLEYAIEVDAFEEEFANGQTMVGDHFFIHDSPSVRDEANARWHRGRYLPFRIEQAIYADWRLRDGMDVLYRDKDANYFVLTPFVRWER